MLLAAAVGATAAVSGCAGGGDAGTGPTPPAATVAAVRITANRGAQIDELGTVPLTAQAQTSGGAVVSGAAITWAALDPAVATVSGAGLVTAVAPGTARVVAAATTAAGSTAADTATITVTAIPVGSVAVADTALAAALAVGDTGTVFAAPRAADGRALSTANGRQVTWSVDDPSVAAVSATGLVTARAVGTTVVRAASGGQTGTATVRVAANPFRLVLTVDQSTGPVSADVVAAARLALRRWERVVGSGSGAALDARDPGCALAAGLAPGQYPIRLRVNTVSAYTDAGALADESDDCLRTDYQAAAGTVTVSPGLAAQAVVNGAANPVVVNALTHEIGHALGIGAWRYANIVAMVDTSTNTFTGPRAAAAWQALGGSGNAPIQLLSRAHWRADATTGLCGEVMAPAVTSGSRLSALTLGALADLGWAVRADRADPFTRGTC